MLDNEHAAGDQATGLPSAGPWESDFGGEFVRDFPAGSDYFAAHVYPATNLDPELEPGLWFWSASRHEDDDRDRSSDEDTEWIRHGQASSAEEGMALADAVLRAAGYELLAAEAE